MKGVTIGLGSYERFANKAAELAKKNLGLDEVFVVRDIDVNHIPSLMAIDNMAFRSFLTKFHLFDISKYDRFIYFDCDCAFVTRPPVHQLALIESSPDFLAVRDRPYSDMMKEIEDDVCVPYGTYVNAGMFVANRLNHRAMFEILKLEASIIGNRIDCYKFQDQWLLNSILFRMRHVVKTTWLHRYWNAQDWNPSWGIMPYGIHSGGNYPRYDGKETFPDLPQGIIPEAPFEEAGKLYTSDGFVYDNKIGRVTCMYHVEPKGSLVRY